METLKEDFTSILSFYRHDLAALRLTKKMTRDRMQWRSAIRVDEH